MKNAKNAAKKRRGGSNTVETLGAKGRKDALPFDPEDLVLVTDPKHTLFDERVHWPIDPDFLANVNHFGVIEPVIVRRNGMKDGKPVLEVIAGRQRVKASREANKLRRARGEPIIYVYAILRRSGDAEAAEISVSENEARADDTPMIRARKMGRLLDLGRTEEHLCVIFCCTIATVKATLALLELAPGVQRAVEKGVVGATFAVQELGKLAHAEQEKKLLVLMNAGTTRGAAARNALEQIGPKGRLARGTPTKLRLRSRRFLERFKDELARMLPTAAPNTPTSQSYGIGLELLKYVLGDDAALPVRFRAAAEKAAGRKKKAA
jgi:ParB family chromosome partitioning protein